MPACISDSVMKQLAQYQDGRLELQTVPRPTPPAGGLLVRVTHSVVSPGTERLKLEQARMNLLQKARARPDQVRNILDAARTLGWPAAIEKVRNRLESPAPLGYSAAGVVEELGAAATRFRVGDRVAVGGAEWAFHAEYIAVPAPLAGRVPDTVENWQAAYTTITSIALHAVRQLRPTLGERVLVMGQGLVGLLVTALLRIHGVRVMAADISAARRRFAEAMGAERVVILGQQSLSHEVREWTEATGVDGAVLCTGTQSNAPIEQSADALRDRGRIVVVGNTKADLTWRTFYQKELEVRYSRSYGPGRYDRQYEAGGVDYPIGYVRWTVQRNFDICLHLMQRGALDLAAITTRRVAFDAAIDVYRELLADGEQDVGVVLEYGPSRSAMSPAPAGQLVSPQAPDVGLSASTRRLAEPVSRVDVIGAGNFARTMLLPHLKGRIQLGTVVNRTALSTSHVKKKFGFVAAATDPAAVLGDRTATAILIASRDSLHAPLVVAALESSRHVFVEKPLCLTRGQLAEIDAALARSTGSIQVGFNRRFAGASLELSHLMQSSPGPKTIAYRVIANALDPQHWHFDPQESGGRVLGEACHFLDYFCFLLRARPMQVLAQTIWPVSARFPFADSVAAQVEFADGSCGHLVYTAQGDTTWPKEECTVYGAGFVAQITNFQELRVHRGRRKVRHRYKGKGHAEQMAAWLAFLRGEAEHPLPYEDARQSMLLTFAVLESIRMGRSVEVL